MPRVKRGMLHTKKRRNVLKKTKGFMWGRKSKLRLARIASIKAGVYAYTDRRGKKRSFRRLWQVKINAATRALGTNYSKLINALNKANVIIDRKILADLAQNHPKIFEEIVKKVIS